MFPIIGAVVVLGAVIGGYLMEHGNLSVLFQPAELVIIGGAALGSFIISAPKALVIRVFKEALGILKGEKGDKKHYLELLMLLYELFSVMRKEGMLAIEGHLQKPGESEIFKRFPSIVSDTDIFGFISDGLKVVVSSNLPPHKLEGMLELDIETQEEELMTVPTSVGKVADSLPGLGIVAAVLGVVLTMGKIDEPPSVLGHSIGAALVGTFLGILMCYGFLGPVGTNLEHRAAEKLILLRVIKNSLVSYVDAMPPRSALESGRRAIPLMHRPTADEIEEAVREWKKTK